MIPDGPRILSRTIVNLAGGGCLRQLSAGRDIVILSIDSGAGMPADSAEPLFMVNRRPWVQARTGLRSFIPTTFRPILRDDADP